MKLHRLLLFALVVACLWFAVSCSSWAAFRRGLYVAAAGAGGAAVGGPGGAAAGAGAVAVVTDQVDENDELRSGELVGKGAHEKIIEKLVYVDRDVIREKFTIPWGKIALWGGLVLFWLKGHHLFALFRGGGLGRLFNIFLPSWAQKAK